MKNLIPQFLSDQTRSKVVKYIQNIELEKPVKVVFKPATQRTLEQNEKIQCVCEDIAAQVVLDTENGGHKHIRDCQNGRQFSKDDWRHLLMAGFSQSEVVPGVEVGQVVCLYPSSTDLGIGKGSDFITYCIAFGNEKGVEWTENE